MTAWICVTSFTAHCHQQIRINQNKQQTINSRSNLETLTDMHCMADFCFCFCGVMLAKQFYELVRQFLNKKTSQQSMYCDIINKLNI